MSLTTQRYQICQSFNEYSSKCDCLSLLNRLFKSLLHFQSFSHISTLKVFAALIEDGTYNWTDEELAMVASQNLINTFRFCYLPFIWTFSFLLQTDLWKKFETCSLQRENSPTTLGETFTHLDFGKVA